jgi:hypothetical protein
VQFGDVVELEEHVDVAGLRGGAAALEARPFWDMVFGGGRLGAVCG